MSKCLSGRRQGPRRGWAHHGVQNRQELAHAGGQGDLRFLAPCAQTL